MAVSIRTGMGANPYVDAEGMGTSFRVWAPFARQVHVHGSFNQWSETAHPLDSEGNGYWSTDVPGAGVGDQYRFVIDGAEPASRMDPYASQVGRDADRNINGVVAAGNLPYHDCSFSTPSWNDLVIYELHLRTFSSGGGFGGKGSFTSAETKLDYLRDLGINAIELMPLHEYLGDESEGYNPAYIFSVEDELGGPDGFRAFVNAAHVRGIAVIVDVVYNHLGDSAGDMWQFDGWSGEPGKGGIYFYNDERSHTAYGETRFDYGRGEVREYLRDNALRWLIQRYADGLRWDSVGSIRNVWDQDGANGALPDGWSLLQWINSEIAARQPWKICIAEDLKENSWITKSVGEGGAGFGTQWSGRFVSEARRALTVSKDAERDMGSMAALIAQKFNDDAFQRVIYTESHDAVWHEGGERLPQAIWPGNTVSWASKKRSTLGAALLMTAPGIPMLFMGQEFLATAPFNDKEALDWNTGASFGGIAALYRDLIRLRRNWFDTTRGLRGQHVHVHHSNDRDKVVAFHRWDEGGARDDVIVVLNFGDRNYDSYTIGLPRSGRWKVRFNSDWQGYDGEFGDTFAYDTDANGGPMDDMGQSGNVGLGAYSAVILSQD